MKRSLQSWVFVALTVLWLRSAVLDTAWYWRLVDLALAAYSAVFARKYASN